MCVPKLAFLFLLGRCTESKADWKSLLSLPAAAIERSADSDISSIAK